MKKMMKGEKLRRILMTLFGVLVCAFSVGLFSHSGMGVDPFQVFAQSLGRHVKAGLGLDYGTFYMILNLAMLVGIFFWNRSKIGLGTVMNIFLVGYIATFSEQLMQQVFPDPGLPVRIGLLAVGVVVMCFGSAFYFTGDLGVSTYDAVARRWRSVPGKSTSSISASPRTCCASARDGYWMARTRLVPVPSLPPCLWAR